MKKETFTIQQWDGHGEPGDAELYWTDIRTCNTYEDAMSVCQVYLKLQWESPLRIVVTFN